MFSFVDQEDSTTEVVEKRRRSTSGPKPETWKKFKAMKQREKGKAYTGRKVQDKKESAAEKPPRKLGPACECTVQLNKCHEFTVDCREEIFNRFWDTMDWGQRKVYIASLLDVSLPIRKKTTAHNSKRKHSFTYHLKKGNNRLRVCKKMFLNTFDLGEWSVRDWAINAADGMHLSNANKTAQLPPGKKNQQNVMNEFLHCLPKVPSHYCRASTTKSYLEPMFCSKAEVYSLYKEYCSGRSEEALSLTQFKTTFKRMKLAIFKPKKDQCDLCVMYEKGNLEEEVWMQHRNRKDQARTEMQSDTEKAKNDSRFVVITMDLQGVLLSPRLQASALYYKTKLIVHNFTMYNNANHDTVCYIWHEGEGAVTSNEFSSCIVDFLSSLNSDVDEVILWSDGCTYQNRNAILSNALLQTAVLKKITITQKILEKGHTQMPCDSCHAKIEAKLKNKIINVPADYVSVVKSARKNPEPYKIKYLDHTFFRKYSSLNSISSIRPGSKAGDAVVTDIRGLKYTPNREIFYKLQLDEEWKLLPKRIGKVPESMPNFLYSESRKIKEEKYKDLQDLKRVLPSDYHAFYDHLSH